MADIEARAIARLRGARRADDRHLHQLPDHPAARARRAPGDGRHRRRHLFQQRDGRAQQLRGRALGAGRRASPAARRATAITSTSTAPAPGSSTVAHRPRDSRRLGRARRHRRPGRQQLLGGAGRHRPRGQAAQLRRAQAFRRRAGELRLGGAVPHAGPHARGARSSPTPSPAARLPPAVRHRQGRLRRLLRAATRRRATRSTWWCSPHRSSR